MNENEPSGPAKALVSKACEKGFIKGKLTVVPELVENEKLLFTFIAKSIKEQVDSREEEELDMQEISNLFTFVYAKGGETAFNWHNGGEFTINPGGIFEQDVPFAASREMIEYFNERTLPDDMFGAFHDWHEHNPAFCAENAAHPLLPLLDALRWTYRIALGMGLEYLGYR